MPHKKERAPAEPSAPSKLRSLGSDGAEDSNDANSHQLSLTVGSRRKNSQDEVRVVLVRYRAEALVDGRVYSALTAAKVPVATRRGVAVTVAKLPALAKLPQKAEEEVRALGLLDFGRA